MKTFLFVALGCVLISFVQADATPTTMNVAVVEGLPLAKLGSIQDNANNYLALVYAGDNKVAKFDIIVFPEYGLTGKTQDKTYAMKIDNNFTTSSNENLTYLNGLAKTKGVLLVANLLEADDDDVYSTTVVLDGSDNLVAKYRKANIKETEKDLKSGSDIATFEHKKSGSVIGLISGDDILYEDPVLEVLKNKVTTVIYTSSLRSIAPFRTAISIHAGFAKAHGVNLLVASLNDVANGVSGSGIYNPCGTTASFIDANDGSKALTGQVDITPTIDCKKSLFTGRRAFGSVLGTTQPLQNLLKFDFNGLTNDIINQNAEKVEKCDGSLCCTFSITSQNWNQPESYRWVVSEDQKVCALVSCSDKSDITSCGKIETPTVTKFDNIEISTSEGDDSFMPYIVHADLTPGADIKNVKFTETTKDGTIFSIVSGVENTIAIGIVAKSGASAFQILSTNIIVFSVLLKYLF